MKPCSYPLSFSILQTVRLEYQAQRRHQQRVLRVLERIGHTLQGCVFCLTNFKGKRFHEFSKVLEQLPGCKRLRLLGSFSATQLSCPQLFSRPLMEHCRWVFLSENTKLLKDGPGLDEIALVAWLHSHPRVEEPKVLKMECCNWPINCQSIWERLTRVFTSSDTRAFYCLQVQTSQNIGRTPVATKFFKDALGGLKHTKEDANEELVLLANDYFANEANDGDLKVSMLVCRSRPGNPMAALLQQWTFYMNY
uniref:Uncharacterized protein n=1 Tax=Ditylenchus dipsaci TaxID=166011 RepID=A0A915EPZ6_9BILA